MKRLTSLVLNLAPSAGHYLLPRLSGEKEKRYPFKLTTFRTSLFYDDYMETFFHNQNEIRNLVIRGPVSKIPNTRFSSFLPKFTTLQCDWKFASAVVSGRPLSGLITWDFSQTDSWSSEDSLSDDPEIDGRSADVDVRDLSSLSRSTAARGVESLFMNWTLLRSGGLSGRQVNGVVPGLLKLSIKVYTPSQTKLEELSAFFTQYLPTAKHLRYIFIRIKVTPKRWDTPVAEDVDFSGLVFASSRKKLKNVVITYQGCRAKYVRKKRRGRGRKYCLESVRNQTRDLEY
ncbi:hypothetical protein CPB83DRAFT_903051 [Crepidotus variabilis]|uniref:Uncharacterized protein n=1 Tax=Crepidotus variabilis TaxID=179855 RepID=A0A9P6JTF3_9AGAR|nr:hypothetical protein CPB83DRAFT_903051 [Crepidotus variabilis]